MSWGATAFTPIVTYNTPPFGFEERQNPSDFGTCPSDPYSATENLKEDIRHLFKLEEETMPLSRFQEPESFNGSYGPGDGAGGWSDVFTFYNIVLFLIAMTLLYFVTKRRVMEE